MRAKERHTEERTASFIHVIGCSKNAFRVNSKAGMCYIPHRGIDGRLGDVTEYG